jgi:hypothetical protein
MQLFIAPATFARLIARASFSRLNALRGSISEQRPEKTARFLSDRHCRRQGLWPGNLLRGIPSREGNSDTHKGRWAPRGFWVE